MKKVVDWHVKYNELWLLKVLLTIFYSIFFSSFLEFFWSKVRVKVFLNKTILIYESSDLVLVRIVEKNISIILMEYLVLIKHPEIKFNIHNPFYILKKQIIQYLPVSNNSIFNSKLKKMTWSVWLVHWKLTTWILYVKNINKCTASYKSIVEN
jgi:hypothetical protein